MPLLALKFKEIKQARIVKVVGSKSELSSWYFVFVVMMTFSYLTSSFKVSQRNGFERSVWRKRDCDLIWAARDTLRHCEKSWARGRQVQILTWPYCAHLFMRSFIQPFIHSFPQHLWSLCQVSGTALCSRDGIMIEVMSLFSWGLHFRGNWASLLTSLNLNFGLRFF